MPLTEEQKEVRRANLARAREAKKARVASDPPAAMPPAPQPQTDLGAPPVAVQMGPTPGYMFAVFRDNPEFHEKPVEVWDAAAKLALQRKVAILGGDIIGDLHKEPLRPFNWMCEYRVAPR